MCPAVLTYSIWPPPWQVVLLIMTFPYLLNLSASLASCPGTSNMSLPAQFVRLFGELSWYKWYVLQFSSMLLHFFLDCFRFFGEELIRSCSSLQLFLQVPKLIFLKMNKNILNKFLIEQAINGDWVYQNLEEWSICEKKILNVVYHYQLSLGQSINKSIT